eukprot:12093426-Alexandrium_andersonii.AAC.1
MRRFGWAVGSTQVRSGGGDPGDRPFPHNSMGAEQKAPQHCTKRVVHWMGVRSGLPVAATQQAL